MVRARKTNWWPPARALAVWLVLMMVETVHGVLRMLLLAPLIGDFRARQISVFTGSVLIFGATWLLIRWIGATTTRALLGTGGLWLVLTVAFEIGIGRLAGRSLETIGSDYDLRHGGLLPIGLAVLVLSPLGAARVQGVARKLSTSN